MSGQANDDVTPTLDKVLSSAIRGSLVSTFTALPAKVVSISGNLVTAEITLKRTVHNVTQSYPLINNVPLRREAIDESSFLHFPVVKGTVGLLIFSQRSLDKWIDSDGVTIVDPEDTRIFNISDATFWPGVLPKSKAVPTSGNVILQHKSTKFELSPNGTFELFGSTGGLLSTVDKIAGNLDSTLAIIDAIGDALSAIVPGAGTPISEAAALIQADLELNRKTLTGMTL